jgi:hypothetical protein
MAGSCPRTFATHRYYLGSLHRESEVLCRGNLVVPRASATEFIKMCLGQFPLLDIVSLIVEEEISLTSFRPILAMAVSIHQLPETAHGSSLWRVV